MNHLRDILRFALPYLRPYWTRIVLGVALGIIFGTSNAAVVWGAKVLIERLSPPSEALAAVSALSTGGGQTAGLARQVASVDQVLRGFLDPWLPLAGRPPDLRQIAGGLFLLPLLMSLRGFLNYLSSYFLGWAGERVVNAIRLDVMRKFTRLSIDFFNRAKLGDLLTSMNADVAQLQRALAVGVSDLVKEPVTILSVAVLLLAINWQLTLFVMVFLPLCIVPVSILGRKVRRAARASVQAVTEQSSQLIEALSGMRVVKAFNLEDRQFERFQELSRQLVHHAMKGLQARELSNPLIEAVSALGIGILITFIYLKGIQFADMVTFLLGVVSFYTPVRRLAALHVIFTQASVSVDRLVAVLREQPTVQDPPRPRSLPAFQRDLRFEHVSFRYTDRDVLRDFQLVIPRGQRLGVAGESGSGKSTLVNLLFRFYDPTAGRLLIDGLDFREVAAAALRSQMALVSQEIVLFDQTVAENIAAGRPVATRAEVEEAARAA
ncbi:MAG: ABC transporter ATP-binding protein, partial [Verrucomicrobiota bacterium]